MITPNDEDQDDQTEADPELVRKVTFALFVIGEVIVHFVFYMKYMCGGGLLAVLISLIYKGLVG